MTYESWRKAPVALVALAALAASCSPRGLAFREDDTVTVLAPRDRSTVSLPLTIRWRSIDPRATFAVLVDRAPMPPGEHLSYLARKDKSCVRTPGCPDRAWFEARHIYRTTGTAVTLDHLPDTRPRERADRKERHEAVIVLLDEQDRRVGEAAFFVEFFVTRDRDRLD